MRHLARTSALLLRQYLSSPSTLLGIHRVYILGLATLGGCSFLPSSATTAFKYFALEPPACPATHSEATTNRRVRLDQVSVDPALDGTRIFYAKSDLERGYYQYSFWVAPPASQFERDVRAALDCEPGLAAVGTSPPFLLRIHLLEFMHDARSTPGSARVLLHAKLFNADRSRELAATVLEATIPVTDYSAEGAVRALNEGAQTISREIARWVVRVM